MSPSNQPGLPPPFVLATILCDHVHRDPANGKCFLMGTFGTIFGRDFPITHQLMMLYLSITEVNRRYRMKIRIIDVDEEKEPLFSQDGELEGNDPIGIIEMIIPIIQVTFPEVGEYRLQILADDEMISERRILVMKIPGEPS